MIYRRLFDVPAWRFRNSFEELAQMRRQMDRLFEDGLVPREHQRAGVFPLINLTEDINNFYVRAELPGVKGDALDIQVTAKNLSISGERKILAEEGVKYHRRERESGSFSRIIGLPAEVDSDKVEAKLQDGVLTVVVPKAETAKPKQISVIS